MYLLWNELIARGSFLSCVLALTVLESDLSNKQGANGGIVLAIEMIDGGSQKAAASTISIIVITRDITFINKVWACEFTREGIFGV